MINLWKFIGLGVLASALFGCVWSTEGIYVTQCKNEGTPEQLCLERWYQRQAEITGDTTWCGLLSDRVGDCVLRTSTVYALAAEDPEGCVRAKDARLISSCKDSVYLHLAAQRQEVVLCDHIEVESSQMYCRDVVTQGETQQMRDVALPDQWGIMQSLEHAAWCDILETDLRWQCLRMMQEKGIDTSASVTSFCEDIPLITNRQSPLGHLGDAHTASEFCLWFSQIAS